MKLRSALILTVLTATVVGYQSSASSASRLASNQIVAQNMSESLEGVSSEVARLALTASSEEALAISDETLAKTEILKALENSAQPSVHFVSAVYSQAQRAGNENIELLSAIAKTPSAPLSILNALAAHKNSAVRVALATNPAINAEIAQKLQQDQTREIKLGLALNPSFARIAPSAAADLIIEVSRSNAKSEILTASYVKKLAERTNYHGVAKRLIQERNGSVEAELVASRFVQTIEALSAL